MPGTTTVSFSLTTVGGLAGAGTTVVDSLLLLLLLSAVVTLWAALYNTVFDVVEHRIAHRAASSRPQRWRVVHALGLEISAVALTWPLLMLLTPLGWQAAFVAEIGLTLAYAAYGYVFHLAFDRLRPVCENSRRPS